MLLGMSVEAFTLVHVVLSLAGIGAGFVVLYGLLQSQRLDGWTAVFLATTLATNLTGFMFLPVDRLLPSHVVGILSLVALGLAIAARYPFRLAGSWRRVYVIAAVVALYFNVFVLVVQSFLKVASLRALAPTQEEAPFAIAQGIVLVAFIALGTLAAKRFRA